MARVKITEYRAKKMLLGDLYQGVSVSDTKKIPLKKTERYVVKVDQGIKKRFKQGLVAVDKKAADVAKVIVPWKKKGFTRFLVEPFMPHEAKEEQYLSLERVRGGIRLLHAKEGGIEIEAHPEAVTTLLITDSKDVALASRKTGIAEKTLAHLLQVFEENYFAFLEINPLVMRGELAVPLDAAVLVDSAASFIKTGWSEEDVVEAKAKHPAEGRVYALQKTTPASLKLNVLNPNGSVFFLLSGGGGSIVIADAAALKGAAGLIGNYGEYSGGPTREETYLYAREIISLMLASRAKQKALVIAGGVANFTDIKKTFAGIIDALSEKAPLLRKAGVKVFVRRGGPNEAAGLTLMKEFLAKEGLLGSLHGSAAPITNAIEDALAYVGT